MLSFTLLGQAAISQNNVPLSQFRSQKEAALLIYLAHTRQAHPRAALATLLWEGSTTKQSLTNLRTALARLRKKTGSRLLITRQTLALAPESRQQVDSILLLDTLAQIGDINLAEKATTLQNALDTYHGDFLADFHLDNAPLFNEWVTATRIQIRRQVIAAYRQLGQNALSTGDYEQGITIARRWLSVDALDEAAHTLLIQLFVASGNKSEARAHYGYAAELLHTELGIQPPAEMTALVKDIQPKRSSIQQISSTVRHNLSPEYDQFFGRQAAQEVIHTRLDQPWCRLVTLAGQGGAGKTRLATTIARSRLSTYPDGVWFIDLANIDPDDEDLAEAIGIEILTALDLRLTGSATPVEQLLAHLQHKQILLLLDNFEYLLDGIQIVLDLLKQCEKVQMIVTSREILGLRAEWAIDLAGLDFPTSDVDEISCEAVDLFLARHAQQRREGVSADDLNAIRSICRMVEGLPLAIELAAALTRHATCRAVADRLRDGLSALSTSLRDVPLRHRNLTIVFEMSWRTLSSELQLRLARLAIFRGGFTTAAAKEVAGADAHQLAALRNKSLLAQDGATGRYGLHMVVREYAAAQRVASDSTLQKHACYYLSLLAQHTEPLQKEAPQRAIVVIEPEIDNVRLAWRTGLAQQKIDWLRGALTPLSVYYQLRGLAGEGEAIMRTTLREARMWDAAGLAFATRAGLERARFQNRLGQYRAAVRTIKSALKLAAQSADRWAEGMAHVLWGESLWRQGEYASAENKLNHALTVAHAIDATLIIGWCHHHLGIINDIQSRYETAHDHLQQACAAWRAIDNAQALSGSLNSLGLVYYNRGDLIAAQQAMEQALTLCNQLDDRHRQSTLVNNLSIMSMEQADYMGAQYYLRLGLELATINGNLTGQGEIYTNLGRNYRLLGETDLAAESLEQGLQISELIGDRNLKAKIMLNLAETTQGQGDLERAESLYKKALKVARQRKLQRTECEALIGMAELLSEIDEKQARQYSVEAVELAKAVQSQQLIDRANAIFSYLRASADINEKNQSV